MWHLVICRAHFNISAVLSGAWPLLSSLCPLAFLLSVLALKALTRRTLMAQCSSKHQHFHLTSGPCSSDFVGPHTQASTVLLNKVVSFVFRLPFSFRLVSLRYASYHLSVAFSGVFFSIRNFHCTRWLSQDFTLDPSIFVPFVCVYLTRQFLLVASAHVFSPVSLRLQGLFLLHRRWYTRVCLRHKSRCASIMFSTCS